MPEGLFPPFAEPDGPSADDDQVVRAFALGEPAARSPRFHVEDTVLVALGDLSAALRIADRTVLVRADLPEAAAGTKSAVERNLRAEGLIMFDEDTLLATPVALQAVGLRLSSWDLWGTDIDDAFDHLRTAAAGD